MGLGKGGEVVDFGVAASVVVFLRQCVTRGIVGKNIQAVFDRPVIDWGLVIDTPEDNSGIRSMVGVKL